MLTSRIVLGKSWIKRVENNGRREILPKLMISQKNTRVQGELMHSKRANVKRNRDGASIVTRLATRQSIALM